MSAIGRDGHGSTLADHRQRGGRQPWRGGPGARPSPALRREWALASVRRSARRRGTDERRARSAGGRGPRRPRNRRVVPVSGIGSAEEPCFCTISPSPSRRSKIEATRASGMAKGVPCVVSPPPASETVDHATSPRRYTRRSSWSKRQTSAWFELTVVRRRPGLSLGSRRGGGRNRRTKKSRRGCRGGRRRRGRRGASGACASPRPDRGCGRGSRLRTYTAEHMAPRGLAGESRRASAQVTGCRPPLLRRKALVEGADGGRSSGSRCGGRTDITAPQGKPRSGRARPVRRQRRVRGTTARPCLRAAGRRRPRPKACARCSR